MNNEYPFPVKPDPVKDNFISLHNFLKDVYSDVKEYHSESVSLFKGLFETNDNSTCNANIFKSCVNNFLKDLSQIENEFCNEHLKCGGYFLAMEGKVLNENEVLSLQMEENY